jgi:hypothetical protein
MEWDGIETGRLCAKRQQRALDAPPAEGLTKWAALFTRGFLIPCASSLTMPRLQVDCQSSLPLHFKRGPPSHRESKSEVLLRLRARDYIVRRIT